MGSLRGDGSVGGGMSLLCRCLGFRVLVDVAEAAELATDAVRFVLHVGVVGADVNAARWEPVLDDAAAAAAAEAVEPRLGRLKRVVYCSS